MTKEEALHMTVNTPVVMRSGATGRFLSVWFGEGSVVEWIVVQEDGLRRPAFYDPSEWEVKKPETTPNKLKELKKSPVFRTASGNTLLSVVENLIDVLIGKEEQKEGNK